MRIASLALLSTLSASPAAAPAAVEDQGPPPSETRVFEPEALPAGAVARLGTRNFRHAGAVGALAWSSDGATLVSAGFDRSVRLWDAASGEERLRIEALHEGTIGDVHYVGGGGGLVSFDATGSLVRFDFENREVSYRLPLGADQAAFDPSGTLVVVYGRSKPTLALHEVATGTLVRAIDRAEDSGRPRCAAFDAAGKKLAYGVLRMKSRVAGDGAVIIEDVATGENAVHVDLPDRLPIALALSSDGAVAVVGTADGVLLRIDTATAAVTAQANAHTGVITTIAFSPDGKTIATGGNDMRVRLFDAQSLALLHERRVHWAAIRAVAFHPDGRLLATASLDQTIRLVDAETLEEPSPLPGHENPIGCILELPDGRIATGGYDGKVILWKDGEVDRVLPANEGYVFSLAFDPQTQRLAAGGQDGTIRVWADVGAREIGHLTEAQNLEPSMFRIANGAVLDLAFSPDGKRIAGACADGKARLWETENFTLAKELDHKAGVVAALAWTPDGARLFTADSIVREWDVATGEVVRTLPGPKCPVRGMALDLERGRIIVGGADRAVHVFELGGGAEILRLDGLAGRVQDVALSPDGRFLAACCESDPKVMLWNADDGSPMRAITGHEMPVFSVGFVGNGSRLVTGSADSTALVWDVAGEDEKR